MKRSPLHRFEVEGRYFAMDTSTCFCFECDAISWDVLEHYPAEPVNHIYRLLRDRHPRRELEEVIGELEWLRTTRAILSPQSDQDLLNEAARQSHLNHLTILFEDTAQNPSLFKAACWLLAAASDAEERLKITVSFQNGVCDGIWRESIEETRKHAGLAGKQVNLILEFPFRPLPESSVLARECQFRLRIILSEADELAQTVRKAAMVSEASGRSSLKTLWKSFPAKALEIVAQPLSENFHAVVKELRQAGFTAIELDSASLWKHNPQANPENVVNALHANLVWFAEQILRKDLFRVEPFVSLFQSIHGGTPRYRVDADGRESLTVDAKGDVYPAVGYRDMPEFRLGNLATGMLNAEKTESLLYAGALQTPSCLQCWAAGLCGGGRGIVHAVRTGNPRTPDAAWCAAQRRWVENAVAVFNRINASGVNFAELAAVLGAEKRSVSLFAAARTLLQDRFSARALREEDASWLVRWENWNRAAYFVCNETGVLTATRYDREMDALHPRVGVRELVLMQRDGTPCGLLKAQPVPERKIVWVWLYLRDETDYNRQGFRRTVADLLSEMMRAHQNYRVLIPVTDTETALAKGLTDAGFVRLGVQREALYQKGGYHDVLIFTSLATLPEVSP